MNMVISDTYVEPCEVKRDDLLISCIIAIAVTMLLLSPTLITTIVKPRMYDGSINELGRYSMTFDAYDHIAATSDSAIIAIGSSKMREAVDGQLLAELDNYQHDFYNLAYAGDRPYVRMLEISGIIESKPEVVILEIGPNTFSSLSTPVPESTLSKMAQLVSIGNVNLDTYPANILDYNDKNNLPNSRKERLDVLSTYVPVALEYSIEIEVFSGEQPYPCSGSKADVRCVPLPDNSTYDDYLRYPIQFRNSLHSIISGESSITIDEFYGPRLDGYLNKSYHNPEGLVNKNQLAFEYMIEQFTSEGIHVILVGLPYNPILLNRLGSGQWDYYNDTIATYYDLEMISVFNMMWDDDWQEIHFNDYTHMSREGEILFASKLMQLLAPVLDRD